MIMATTLASLQKDLEEYPVRLQQALKRQARAEKALERLQEQMDAAEAIVDDEPVEDAPVLAKLRLRYEQKKAMVELQIRREPPVGLKITEDTVRAFIQADDELCALKEQLIDLEIRQREERMAARARRLERGSKPVDSSIMAKLLEAEEEEENADIELQVLQNTLETYRMLTIILTGAKAVQPD
jgi:hypothetical protein